MGIQVVFNPDLALRNMSHFESGERKETECIPVKLEVGKIYDFLKREQRNYWLFGEVPLLETKGSEELSRPIASIQILEATHFLINKEGAYVYPLAKDNELLMKGDVWTRGKYKVIEVFKDNRIQFEGLDRVGAKKF
ncbi:hypothetical protein HN784_00090 [bacterium]|jgi:hypothetical protein|nr:hypothetical protein [bacterium]MBT4251021.1 hypothetical protein [bacterium]MBT4597747.1 hypothetical protein [bacterium]MBT6753842.1 hypothetical protein [bacterium]MBT7037446.1 hypothetical protein [bacterium]